MKLPRFYVPPANITSTKAILTPSVIQHAVKTLRMQTGDNLILFDGSGLEYEARLLRENGKNYSAQIEKTLPRQPEIKPRIFLHQAPIKKEPWEWLLEKATELGVHSIIPLLTKYVEVDVTENFAKKRERWETILQSAAEQSERTVLPELFNPVPLREALRKAAKPALFFYEGSDTEPLKPTLAKMNKPDELSIFIGPVGGFAEEEVADVRSLGIPIVSLGNRVLRAETAALAAVSFATLTFAN